MRDIVIWGGTGNFKVLCELLRAQFNVIGYFDSSPDVEKEYRGIPCLGNRDSFLKWIAGIEPGRRPHFIVSIGPGHGLIRSRIHEELKESGLRPITAIHPTAFVAYNAVVGEGSQIYANAAVCVDAQIGSTCIINTGANVDHECVVDDGASIGPGATLAGLVRVGKNADVYTGATVLPRLEIGEGAIVGAGAVVLEDVPPYTVVVGNPARAIRRRKP